MYIMCCPACTSETEVHKLSDTTTDAYGSFKVKEVPKGRKMERWFINLKRSLKRHIIKLQHHQKVAVYEVMMKQNENSRKDIYK